jgi:hypothetical protein
MANRRPIVTNGSKCFLFLKPGIARVRRVINKLVNDIVELTPAKITDNIKISWEPIPVNFILDENGVINVQPAVVSVLLEHLVK